MFSDKENINILTSLLTEYGVSDAVVCPGSRNAPIVHNLNECASIRCHAVTDERSAGFMAMGMAIATGRPTVVCVTSGSALLNVAPAAAEAFYQHVPLIVVSADRPQQWIDQLDGQTLPQPNALQPFVRKAVSLPEPHNAEQRWHCNRLVNEALHAATLRMPAPVHINVPITEPLFNFNVECLPKERRFRLLEQLNILSEQSELLEAFHACKRPLIVIGQMAAGMLSPATMLSLMQHFVVFSEPLSNPLGCCLHFDEAIRLINNMGQTDADAYCPDYIIYVGDTIVSKQARQWLRRSAAPSCLITADAACTPDPIMTLTDICECAADDIDLLLSSLCDDYDDSIDDNIPACPDGNEAEREAFCCRWQQLLTACANHATAYVPDYSQMAAVKCLEEQIGSMELDVCTHYANSTAIRLACIYAGHYVWCNRGVNGIEGSLSTAAGFSIASDATTVCVVGDLSFFYDQNALWNNNIDGRLRILLLNNSGGGIFEQLPGLNNSGALQDYIEATHSTTAHGICSQCGIDYMAATDTEQMQHGITALLSTEATRPMLLEVFTNKNIDAEVISKYYKQNQQPAN